MPRTQLFALSVANGDVKQLTDLKASVQVGRDAETGRFIINYSDPKTPPSTYTVGSLRDAGDKSKWTRLTDPNPWVNARNRARRRRGDHLEVDRRHAWSAACS